MRGKNREKKSHISLLSHSHLSHLSTWLFFFVTAAGDFTPTLSLSIPLSLPYPLAPELSDCSIFLLPLWNQIIQPVTCVLPNFKSDYHNSTSMPPFLLQQIFAIAAVKCAFLSVLTNRQKCPSTSLINEEVCVFVRVSILCPLQQLSIWSTSDLVGALRDNSKCCVVFEVVWGFPVLQHHLWNGHR